MTEEQNVPPSDDVRQAEEAEADYRRLRRGIRRFYTPQILLAVFAIGTLWWNAATPGDMWWFAPAMATFWVLWGTHGTTVMRNQAYEWGFTQGTMVTMTAIGLGRVPPIIPPHISQASTLSKKMEAMTEAAKREDDEA